MSVKASYPTYAVMALMAVKSIKSFSKAASRPAIKAFVEANYKIGKAFRTALRAASTKLVSSGAITQDGARFKLSKVALEAAEKKKAAPINKRKKGSTKKVNAAPTVAPSADDADIRPTCPVCCIPCTRRRLRQVRMRGISGLLHLHGEQAKCLRGLRARWL
jgi:hypothetical protein